MNSFDISVQNMYELFITINGHDLRPMNIKVSLFVFTACKLMTLYQHRRLQSQ